MQGIESSDEDGDPNDPNKPQKKEAPRDPVSYAKSSERYLLPGGGWSGPKNTSFGAIFS